MSASLKVVLDGTETPVGTLYHNHEAGRESAAFAYEPSWLGNEADRFALEPELPLTVGMQYHKPTSSGASIFHNVIADSEPDGWGKRVILRDYAKRRELNGPDAQGGRQLNHLDFLLAVDDLSRIGALRYQSPDGVFHRPATSAGRTTPPLIEIGHLIRASNALEMEAETAADLAYLRGHGTSVGGMRPKCTVVDEEGRLCIGKFPSVGDTIAVTEGEVLAMQLARKAGINAAESRLVHCDGTPVALITRFDRSGGGRLMYASAATMLSADPAEEHSYTDIADTLRMISANASQDVAELWRRMAFTVLINNVDDHLRNHGFLHVGGGHWRLAPAFDVNPSPGRARNLKTWLSPEAGNAASVEALWDVAPYFQLKVARARAILSEVSTAVARWREHGRMLGLSENELDGLAPAFEHGDQLVAQKLLAKS